MLADMMLFARPPQLKVETVDLVPVVTGLLADLAAEAAEQQTQLISRADSTSVCVTCDPIQIGIAIRALCINALEALGAGGNIAVKIARRDEQEPHVEITVTDNGAGIPTEILA